MTQAIYKPQESIPDGIPREVQLMMPDVHQGLYMIDLRAKGTVFVDIDGTLADIEHRRMYVRRKPKNWPAFERAIPDDEPIQWVIDAVNRLYCAGWTVVLMSGRSEKSLQATQHWLDMYGVFYHALYMRREFEYDEDGNVKLTRKGKPQRDFRRDDIVKEELLGVARGDGFDPDIVFDDRNQVVAMWRKLGIPVVQVAEGDF